MFYGFASFINNHKIKISRKNGSSEIITGDKFILCTGSKPFHPDNIDFTHMQTFHVNVQMRALAPRRAATPSDQGGSMHIRRSFPPHLTGGSVRWLAQSAESAAYLPLPAVSAPSLIAHAVHFPRTASPTAIRGGVRTELPRGWSAESKPHTWITPCRCPSWRRRPKLKTPFRT